MFDFCEFFIAYCIQKQLLTVMTIKFRVCTRQPADRKNGSRCFIRARFSAT
jgi:hypothetical protein